MSKKLRVLFLPKWYPNKFDNLDGNFVENHAKAISKFAKVHVLFVHSDAGLQSPFKINESTEMGLQVIRVYFKKPQFKIQLLNKGLAFFRFFNAQLKGYKHYLKSNPKPDIVHIHVLGRTAPLALLLRFKHKIPYFITEHWSGYRKESDAYKGLLKKWVTQFTVKKAAYTTTVSEDLKNAMLKRHLHGNYSVIPNVIDLELFRPSSKSINSKPRLIHISNLSSKPKNLQNIISILIELAQEGNVFEFILIGYGDEENAMLDLIKNTPLEALTQFKGKLTTTEVAKELAQSDMMLLFSLYENQPVVMLESFASGIPVVVPNIGGIAEIMNEELGYLIEPQNNLAFKNALIDFFKNRLIFNSETIRSYAEDKFSENKVGKQFMSLYNQVLVND